MKKKLLGLLCLMWLTGLPLQAQQPQSSYIAVEVNSGKVLYSSRAEVKRPVSGLAQIATAIVAQDWVDRTQMNMDVFISVPESINGMPGNPMNLQPGDQITLRDALYSCMMGSDNVSSMAIATYVGRDLARRQGGGEPVSLFVTQMNKLAHELKMVNTKFIAPHGLDMRQGVNVSCAADIILLSTYAMQNPSFTFMAKQATRNVKVRSMQGVVEFAVKNTNPLLGQSGYEGIKTANASSSGPCCVISAFRTPRPLIDPSTGQKSIFTQKIIAVVLGSANRYDLAKTLVTQGWSVWDDWAAKGMQRVDGKEFLMLPRKGQ